MPGSRLLWLRDSGTRRVDRVAPGLHIVPGLPTTDGRVDGRMDGRWAASGPRGRPVTDGSVMGHESLPSPVGPSAGRRRTNPVERHETLSAFLIRTPTS